MHQHAGPGWAWIITPALHPARFGAAQTSGAAVAVVDLEDSVAMADKHTARTAAQRFFEGADTPAACTLGVRINAPTTLEGARDLVALADYTTKPDLLVVPKVESARDIELVAGVLDADGYAPDLWALIETPRAINELASICTAPRLGGLVFGAADYAASLRCALKWQALAYARSAVVNSAAQAGIRAIDSPCFDLNDMESLREESLWAKQLGFHGKGAVHVCQAALINEVFAPSEEEIAHARSIVAAAQASGNGITAVGGQMVGPPFFRVAQDLLRETDDRTHP